MSGNQTDNTSVSRSNTYNLSDVRPRLRRSLQLHGYSACREALALLADHYVSSTKYESIEDFVIKLNSTITFEIDADTDSVIDPDLAHTAIQLLCNSGKKPQGDSVDESRIEEQNEPQVQVPTNLTIKIKNVDCEQVLACLEMSSSSTQPAQFASIWRTRHQDDFPIHYNYLFKRLSSLPVFSGDFQLTRLESLTASNKPSIRCLCFGLLIKDLSKIDSYLLIDNTSRVPLRIKPETSFRNRLAYSNCIVLVEGVYINPDDVLYAANIGLPPILLEPIQNKSMICTEDKMVVILKELFLDDDDVIKGLDMLFSGYNSMEDPPILFILIGNFTRDPCKGSELRIHTKKLIRILRTCDNLKNSHFVFVPGQNDTNADLSTGSGNVPGGTNFSVMPKVPLTKEQFPVNLLHLSDFNNVHLATNPVHIQLDDRTISVVSHSYIKELHKHLLHDLSDHREELFETVKQIILSNGHLTAGINKIYCNSLNLWHKPDLLVLADSGAFGNRYDYSSSSIDDTSFTTVPSFARQSNQFKVYYIKTGEVEDSQVSSDAYLDIEEDDIDEPQKAVVNQTVIAAGDERNDDE